MWCVPWRDVRNDHLLTRVLGTGLVLAATAGLAACGGTSDASPTSAAASSTPAASAAPTAPVLATVGGLRIVAGYVPAPASPSVGAAYFTVVNTGTTADSLVKAGSDASRTTTLHRTEGGAMVALDRLDIPAGGSASFTAGADHLMLENLTRTLTKGDRVTLTLEFTHAGTVTVTLPVTGYPTDGTLPSEALSPLPSTTVAP